MAYLLGFISADGTLIKNNRGAHFLEIEITDKELIFAIRKILNSDHKITSRRRNSRWKTAYRLQIGSKEIFNALIKLGITPHKSRRLQLPKIPSTYLGHFVRGYFDGDGYVWRGGYQRPDTLKVVFTSGSKQFLEKLAGILKKHLKIVGVLAYSSSAYQLSYSTNPSLFLYKFMYNDANLFLDRKKRVFDQFARA